MRSCAHSIGAAYGRRSARLGLYEAVPPVNKWLRADGIKDARRRALGSQTLCGVERRGARDHEQHDHALQERRAQRPRRGPCNHVALYRARVRAAHQRHDDDANKRKGSGIALADETRGRHLLGAADIPDIIY
eukprot:6186759-Pleurochrysis_carterae.AAC.2